MFGQNKLFGSSTQSAFSNPGTSGFGSSGTFGNTLQQQPSLFGSTANNFGQAPQTSLFGSQPSMFGTSNAVGTSSAFGQPSTSANVFGTAPSSTPSLFGGNTQQSSLFGGNRFGAAPSTTPFGATTNTVPGTVIKFNAPTGTDSMIKSGIQTTISTRHQCITCMKEYENKSLEELRLEDYQANRKGSTQATGLFGTSNTLFGSQQQQTSAFSSQGSLFGAQNKPPAFGSPATVAATSTTSTLFGASSFNKPNTLFGSQTQSTNTFGAVQPQPQQASLFGQPASSAATLSQPNFFSNTNNTAQVKPSLFGTTPQQPQTPAIGSSNFYSLGMNKPLVTSQPNTNFGLGNTGGGLTFNNPSSGTLFSSQPSLFGASNTQNQTASKPLFNFQPQPTLQLNTNLSNTGNTGASLFGGNTSFGNTGTSLFGNTGTSIFGNTGLQNAQQQTTLQSIGSTQSPNSEMLLSRLQTLPYGDSPLFQNDLSNTSSSSIKTKFTTDPKTIYQYKVNAKSVSQKLDKVVNSPRSTSLLFDGLEEESAEEIKSAQDIFVPRRNVKKLVLKPKSSGSEQSSLTSNNNTSLNANRTQNENSLTDNTIDLFENALQRRNDNRIEINTQIKERLNTSSLSDSATDNNSICEISQTTKPLVLKCGVVLSKDGYFTIPSLEQLDSFYDPVNDVCIIDSFTIGRSDYGSIYWSGPLNIKGLNLDDIVHIRRKEVIVYPDDDNKPLLGEGLNRPAEVTLHQVWPVDKSTHEIIKNSERIAAMKYAEKIENATVKLGATFKEYRPETGSWIFTVKHFSKYGLEDDDEEAEPTTSKVEKQVQMKRQEEKTESPLKTFDEEEEDYQYTFQEIYPTKPMEGIRYQPSYYNKQDEPFDQFDSKYAQNIFESPEFDFENFPCEKKFSEFDLMRKSLFQDFDDAEMPIKRTKKSAIKTFETKMPAEKLIMPKRRTISLEPELLAARYKLVCDISSVCVSSAPRVSFFGGSKHFSIYQGSKVWICQFSFVDSIQSDRFQEQLLSNSLISPSSHLMTSSPLIESKPFAKNSRSAVELETFVEALYGILSENSLYARHQERYTRILKWLFSRNKEIKTPVETFPKILYFLATNEMEKAVNKCHVSRQPRLAKIISCGSAVSRNLILSQLDSWKQSGSDEFVNTDLLKIYILLSGQLKWVISTGKEISVLNGLHWTQQLSLMLVYADQAGNSSQDLMNYFLSHLTTSTNDVEFHMLSNHSAWITLSASPLLIDAWFLQESLKCYGVIKSEDVSNRTGEALHSLLASQLETVDIRWACFVALHIQEPSARNSILQDILGRNSHQLTCETTDWLTQMLAIPIELIAEAKATKAKAIFDFSSYAENLLLSKKFAAAHDVFVDHVFPELIINENYKFLDELISGMRLHKDQIPNWYSGAHIYDAFLVYIDDPTCFPESMENFNIHNLKCSTKRHVLCQSEMARKCNVMYSTIAGSYLYDTPIPDDYALMELRANAKYLTKMLASK